MLRKNRPKSSSIFLMEFILAVLFFSVASAVCVQFFVKSHVLSQRSQTLAHAVSECSSIAEICRTSESLADAEALLADEYPTLEKGNTILLYFDDEFAPCDQESATSKLELSLSQDEQMLSIHMNVCATTDEALIYELETSHHIPRRADHE